MTVQEIFSKWEFAWASTDDDMGYQAYTHSRQPLLQKFKFTSAFWQLQEGEVKVRQTSIQLCPPQKKKKSEGYKYLQYGKIVT